MNNIINKKKILILVLSFALVLCGAFVLGVNIKASTKATMTRQGDVVWFGYYPQTKATDEEMSKMSVAADEEGFYTSGKDRFIKVSNANPSFHYEIADTDYIPFNDESEPIPGETYYFKMEPIEWKVMVDDDENNVVKMVSRYFLDAHCWLSAENVQQITMGVTYYNISEGVPENTPANSWRYSEMRSWLNDDFYNFAFSEEEQKSIYLFSNKNTIDYRSNDESTIVNDYVAIGNREDYNSAGDDGLPTDYTIVKGATWCYNKTHTYYYVNATFANFGSDTVRTYRHDEHEKCASVDSVEAVRPIIYVNRSDAKIIATESQKEERSINWMLIIGLVSLLGGGVLAIPTMISTSKKQKQVKAETGSDYKLTKKEAARIAPGMFLVICGIVLIGLKVALFGGFGGSKLNPGIYLQQGSYSGSGIAQVGSVAYRINGDGTFDYTDYYQGDSSIWSGHGTYSISGSIVTFVWKGNPMVTEGYSVDATIYDSNTFGNSSEKFKRIT